MYPIFEQGGGHGVGHNADSFLNRVEHICAEHLRKGRAKAFAFILYDFHDAGFKEVLKDIGVFAQLDRLSGDRLSVFYIHSGSLDAVIDFNSHLLQKFGLGGELELPCIIFCKLSDGQFTDIVGIHIDGPTLVHGFHEIYLAIEKYISENAGVSSGEWLPGWLAGSIKFVSTKVFAELIKGAVDRIMPF